ncbi:hypothetical protein DMENIID0001_014250 [Sergentomyia squamirostris]
MSQFALKWYDDHSSSGESEASSEPIVVKEWKLDCDDANDADNIDKTPEDSSEVEENIEPSAKRAKIKMSSPETQELNSEYPESKPATIVENVSDVSVSPSREIVTAMMNWMASEAKSKELMIMSQKMILEENRNLREAHQNAETTAHLPRKVKPEQNPEVMQNLVVQKDEEHKLQLAKISNDHDKEVGRLKNRLDELRAIKMDAEREAKDAVKILEEVRREKDSEIKVIKENHEKESNEVKKSHERELLELYGSVKRLEQELKKGLKHEMDLQAIIDTAQTNEADQKRKIQSLETKINELQGRLAQPRRLTQGSRVQPGSYCLVYRPFSANTPGSAGSPRPQQPRLPR